MTISEPNNTIKIILKAEREVAYSSPDHQMPWGTRRDNSKNKRFNEKVYQLYSHNNEPLKVLDLGCSGGGFVKDCIDDGCLAVGLEGSDFSKKHRRAEWAIIPEFLFTCDITSNFELYIGNSREETLIHFDVVTSWELIEHIAEVDLPKLATNIKRHISDSSLWIMSVSPNEEIIGGMRLHQTVKPKEWWIRKFSELGFTHLENYVEYFNTQFVRGPKYEAPGSFHLALSVNPGLAPKVPNQKFVDAFYDTWLGSRLQRKLRKWVLGR